MAKYKWYKHKKNLCWTYNNDVFVTPQNWTFQNVHYYEPSSTVMTVDNTIILGQSAQPYERLPVEYIPYITTGSVEITDEGRELLQQMLDDRPLNYSMGCTVTSTVCSICGQDTSSICEYLRPEPETPLRPANYRPVG